MTSFSMTIKPRGGARAWTPRELNEQPRVDTEATCRVLEEILREDRQTTDWRRMLGVVERAAIERAVLQLRQITRVR